jgi:hypothetical protein
MEISLFEVVNLVIMVLKLMASVGKLSWLSQFMMLRRKLMDLTLGRYTKVNLRRIICKDLEGK